MTKLMKLGRYGVTATLRPRRLCWSQTGNLTGLEQTGRRRPTASRAHSFSPPTPMTPRGIWGVDWLKDSVYSYANTWTLPRTRRCMGCCAPCLLGRYIPVFVDRSMPTRRSSYVTISSPSAPARPREKKPALKKALNLVESFKISWWLFRG